MSNSPAAELLERQYDWSRVSPSVAVIDTIARFEKTTAPQMAVRLDPALGRTIDADALDTVLDTTAAVSISFTYADYRITITDDTVAVSRSNPAPS